MIGFEFMKYIIPAICAFLVGLFLWLIKRDRQALTYEIIESEVFPQGNNNGRYFIAKLKNIGNTAVQNISYGITLSDGNIDSVKFSNSDLVAIETKTESKILGNIDLLNPKEELQTTLTISQAKESSKILLEARGIGVTAQENKGEAIPSYFLNIIMAICVTVAASTAFSAWTSLNQSYSGPRKLDNVLR